VSQGLSAALLADELLLNTRRLLFRASDVREPHEAESSKIQDSVRQLVADLTSRLEGLYRLGVDQSVVSIYSGRSVEPLAHANLDLRRPGYLIIRYYFNHRRRVRRN
jgi:hypothetical protein